MTAFSLSLEITLEPPAMAGPFCCSFAHKMVPGPDGFEGMFFVRQEIQLSLTNMVGWTG
jgi:hypothetical protein